MIQGPQGGLESFVLSLVQLQKKITSIFAHYTSTSLWDISPEFQNFLCTMDHYKPYMRTGASQFEDRTFDARKEEMVFDEMGQILILEVIY